MGILKKTQGIDEAMQPVIDGLNTLGLKTLACCAGHEEGAQAYLSLELGPDVQALITQRSLSIYWRTNKEKT